MNNIFSKSLLIIISLVFHSFAVAEDIDLFVGATTSGTDLPNVLLVIDNAASFQANASGDSANNTCTIDGATNLLAGKAGGVEQCALYNVISALDATTATVNLGIMMYNGPNVKTSNNVSCIAGAAGGCLVQPLVPLNKANKDAILAFIKSWTVNNSGSGILIKASSQATGQTMQEAWAYFAGYTGISGVSYASIKPDTGCLKNYVVFVGNAYGSSGTPGDSTSGNNAPKNSLEGTNTAGKNANPAATTLQQTKIIKTLNTSCGSFTFPNSDAAHDKGYYADEWARYMASQNITTYTIGVLGSSCQASYAALLTTMAKYGNGQYYPTNDYATLVSAFQKILSEIQSVDSVFSSVSLPVSVNTQGTYINQVYIGMFRPDKDVLPRWHGNLKQYKLGYIGTDEETLYLLDADDASAISSADSGFISECARSYWTPTTPDNYWTFLSEENCAGFSAQSNYPDGNLVEKGAQAYKVRSTATRVVKTCSPGAPSACTTLTDFNNTNVTQAMLGAASTTERDALINWQHGLDVDDENIDTLTTTQTRPSVHGDVVHSRPVAINYGTDDARIVVVFYGGNDGILRAINGNRTESIGSVAAGSELWAFVAPEFYSKIKRIRDNTTTISFPGSTITTPTPLPKEYGIDGPIVAYKDTGSALVLATMRRGGRVLYAFNVTDPTAPTLKWKIGCPNNFPTTGTVDDSDCTSGFSGLGQTWSSPRVVKAAGYVSGTEKLPILIMGGGYDTCQDADPNAGCSSSSKGTKIYVMDANSGALLQTFDTDSSVIADITVVPDSDGLIKYAYTADLGGNIYRISGSTANTAIGTTAPGSWTITKVAALGGSDADNRKFMFQPDILDDDGTYRLLIGSGDREKPVSSYTGAAAVENRFYMIKDKPTDAAWLTSQNATCGANVICNASLVAILGSSSDAPSQTDLDAKKGWYLTLTSTEQVVTSAITVFGTVTFSTHQPTAAESTECASLGTATVYNIDFTNAAANVGTVRGQVIAGGGLPPSPVAGMVTLDDGTTVPFIIGANPNSPLEGGNPPQGTAVERPKSRVYWNIKK